MPDLTLRWNGGVFIPISPDERTERWLGTLSQSADLQAKICQPRNPKFHRKAFGLLKLGFDCWAVEPEMDAKLTTRKGQRVEHVTKNFDQFREWVTVMAGYYEVVGYPDGSARARAKSISFSNMDEAQFQEYYSTIMNVILQKIVPLRPKAEFEAWENAILTFEG